MRLRITGMFKSFFNSEKVGGLILVICTIVSLIIANGAAGESYIAFIHRKLDLSVAGLGLNLSIEHWVNDGLMVIFFLMVGLEVKREIFKGELSDPRKAILPIAAAMGGMLVPALIHYMFNNGQISESGFAIPMATDIAFALGILSLAGNRVPVSVKVFLAALAIIDDIGAILVIAFFYTQTLYFSYLLAALGILVALLVLNRMKVRTLAIYLVAGLVMWYCFLKSGVHATIAGVLLAFVIPFDNDDEKNISLSLQHFLHKPVGFIILPVFAVVNTAILVPSDLIGGLSNNNSMGIIAGLVLGKLLGIFGFPFLMVKAGLANLQEGINWKNLAGIGLLGGIGFTMSMFISNLAFTDPELISNSKLSILIGSTFSAIIGLTVFYTNRPMLKNEM